MWRENLQMLVLLRISHLFLFHTHLWLPNGCEPLQPDIKVANFFDAMLLDLDGSWVKQCKLQTLLLWHWEGLQNRDKPTDQWTSQPTLNCKRCSWIWKGAVHVEPSFFQIVELDNNQKVFQSFWRQKPVCCCQQCQPLQQWVNSPWWVK